MAPDTDFLDDEATVVVDEVAPGQQTSMPWEEEATETPAPKTEAAPVTTAPADATPEATPAPTTAETVAAVTAEGLGLELPPVEPQDWTALGAQYGMEGVTDERSFHLERERQDFMAETFQSIPNAAQLSDLTQAAAQSDFALLRTALIAELPRFQRSKAETYMAEMLEDDGTTLNADGIAYVEEKREELRRQHKEVGQKLEAAWTKRHTQRKGFAEGLSTELSKLEVDGKKLSVAEMQATEDYLLTGKFLNDLDVRRLEAKDAPRIAELLTLLFPPLKDKTTAATAARYRAEGESAYIARLAGSPKT